MTDGKGDVYMARGVLALSAAVLAVWLALGRGGVEVRSEEHTSELQSRI